MGAVAVGSDADVVVWDPKATRTISAKRQVSRIDYNVFEGFSCTGGPTVTIARGRIVWTNGDLRAEAGDGRYVERPAFSPVHVANATWKQLTTPRAVARAAVTP
jgi:dihydropyrimidinase